MLELYHIIIVKVLNQLNCVKKNIQFGLFSIQHKIFISDDIKNAVRNV